MSVLNAASKLTQLLENNLRFIVAPKISEKSPTPNHNPASGYPDINGVSMTHTDCILTAYLARTNLICIHKFSYIRILRETVIMMHISVH